MAKVKVDYPYMEGYQMYKCDKSDKEICKNCKNWKPMGGCPELNHCSIGRDSISPYMYCCNFMVKTKRK